MVPPHGRWLRKQEVTQHIHPTKQGYRVISVPATGLFWSTIWSTLVGASDRGGYGGYRIQARPKIGHSKLSSLAEFTLQGWCHAGACPQRVWEAPCSPACFIDSEGFRLSQRPSVTPSESPERRPGGSMWIWAKVSFQYYLEFKQ